MLSSLLLAGIIAAPPAGAAPPAPLVGRVAAVDGAVALRSPGGAWQGAEVNEPVAGAMSMRTAASGRAQLRVGADSVALASDSDLELGQLDAGTGLHLLLQRGRIGVVLSTADPAHTIEIDTPHGQVWLQTAGDYDIAAGDAKAPGRLAVFAGRARFIGKGGDTTVASGEAIPLGAADAVPTPLDGPAADDFVAWWRPATGAEAAASPALAHVSADMTGYAALDGSGDWQTMSGSGAVWFPRTVPSGWAPYRFGHWRWMTPWGWTWIDDAAWGFAPSHYGRWARFPAPDGGDRWGWVPGLRVGDPAFMPAVVAFLGTAGVGISYPDASGPAVGWFPLAPGEVYWPRYTTDPATIRRLNLGSVADVAAIGPTAAGAPPASVIDGSYRNRAFASVVPRAVFVGGKPVAAALVQLPKERLKNAPLLAGSPDISPAAPHAVAVASAAGRRKVAAVAIKRVAAMRQAPGILRARHARHRIVAVGWRERRLHRRRLSVIRASFRRAERRHLRLAAFRRR
ncbi:MAG TPA: DUF6600 domain-containing protein [Stellaceae bacterium]|nr:DUF6600 domain-containing protein [Stellaceae bacterium]